MRVKWSEVRSRNSVGCILVGCLLTGEMVKMSVVMLKTKVSQRSRQSASHMYLGRCSGDFGGGILMTSIVEKC